MILAQLDPKVPRAKLVPRALKAIPALRELLAHRVLRVIREPPAP